MKFGFRQRFQALDDNDRFAMVVTLDRAGARVEDDVLGVKAEIVQVPRLQVGALRPIRILKRDRVTAQFGRDREFIDEAILAIFFKGIDHFIL